MCALSFPFSRELNTLGTINWKSHGFRSHVEEAWQARNCTPMTGAQNPPLSFNLFANEKGNENKNVEDSVCEIGKIVKQIFNEMKIEKTRRPQVSLSICPPMQRIVKI